jgi:hypothetical protein
VQYGFQHLTLYQLQLQRTIHPTSTATTTITTTTTTLLRIASFLKIWWLVVGAVRFTAQTHQKVF